MHGTIEKTKRYRSQNDGVRILQMNCVGRVVQAERIGRRRQRLSALVKQRARQDKPFIVSVHEEGTALHPTDDTVRLRRAWSSTLVGPTDTVVITYLPHTGGNTSTLATIGIALAMVALVAASGPLAAAAFGALGGFGTATAATAALLKAGIVIGGGYLLSLATKAKANNTQDRPIYSVSGGGNLPRPGDRIPRPYGLCWHQPDLSQPDYFVYDGEDQVLYKRMTYGLGKHDVKIVQVGTATFWTKEGGIQAPFAGALGGSLATQMGHALAAGGGGSSSGGGSAIEIIPPGGTSTLVPATVYSNPSVVGIELPRTTDNPAFAGPYPTCPVGQQTDTIQLDFSLPDGAYHQSVNTANSIDAIVTNIMFQYAPCDDNNQPTGPYTTLHNEAANLKSTRPLRYTRIKTVPMGRGLIKAWNGRTANEQTKDRVFWDGMRAHFKETIVRPHVTEIAMKIRSGKSLGVTSFGEIWVQANAILPVWNGSAWVEQETRKAVYAYRDALKSDYGGNMADDQIDMETIKARAASITQFDTFDEVLRGPVSLWEASCTLLGVIRGEPVRLGQLWSMARDEQKVARKPVFTRRQIIKGSSVAEFSIARDDGAAHVIGEFSPDADPRRNREVPVVYGAASTTPRRVRWRGVSSWDHAHHLTKWTAIVAYKRRERRKFSADRQGRIVTRGDPARVDSWFMSDCKAAGVMHRMGNSLILDTEVSVVGTLWATLRNRTGLEWGPVRVIQGAQPNVVVLNSGDVTTTETSTGDTLAEVLAGDTADMTSIVIGSLTELQDPFLIDSVQPQSRDNIQIEAVYDHPDVWVALGEAPPTAPIIPGPGDEVEPDVAVVPWVSARVIQKATGLFLEWAVGRARGAERYVVKLSYEDTGTNWEEIGNGIDTSGVFALRHEEGANGRVGAFAVSKSGNPGPAVYTTFTTFKPAITQDNATVDGAALDAESVAEEALANAAVTARVLAAEAVTKTAFAASIRPNELVSALPDKTSQAVLYAATNEIVFNTTDRQLYRKDASKANGWTSDVAATGITGQLSTAQIADAAITAAKIGTAAVEAGKIAASAVGTTELAALAVTEAKVAASAITSTKIGAAAVEAGKIAALAVGTSELQALAVSSAKVVDSAIITAKIATDAVDASKIAASAVGSSEIAALAVVAGKIAANAVGTSELADLSISTSKVALAAITTTLISDSAITTPKVAAGAIVTTSLAANAVTASKIVVGSYFENLVQNGGLEDGVATWTAGANNTISSSSNSHTGSYSMLIVRNSTAVDLAALSTLFPVSEGQVYEAGMWYGPASSDHVYLAAVLYLAVSWFDVSGVQLSNSLLGPQAIPNGWSSLRSQTTAPSSARFARVFPYIPASGGVTTTNLVVDDVFVRKASGTTTIEDNAITTGKIVASAVTAAKILAGTITTTQIASTTILADNIASGTITATQIAAATITASNVAADTLTASQIAAGAITSSELASSSVIAGKIAAGTIVAADIAANTITAAKIAAGTITSTEVATDTLTATNIAAGAIATSELASGAVTAVKITASSITANEIAANTITAAKIAAGTITTTEIASATIVAGNIAASTITGDKIAAATITASNLVANTITAGVIAAGAIGTTQLAAGAVTTSILAANAVVASKIAVGSYLENLCQNGGFEDGINNWGAVSYTGTASIAVSTNSHSGSNALKLSRTVAGGTVAARSDFFPVTEGATYEVECWKGPNTSGEANNSGGFYLAVYWYNSSQALMSGAYVASNDTIPNGFSRSAGQWLVPANARFAKIELELRTGGPTIDLIIDDVRVRKAGGTTYIEDGAITTNKIVAGAIVAGKIAAGAVNAASIIVNDLVVTGHLSTGAASAQVVATHVGETNPATGVRDLVTAPSVTILTGRARITYSGFLTGSGGIVGATVEIYKDGAATGQTVTVSAKGVPSPISWVDTSVSNASHTYKIRANSGADSVQYGAGVLEVSELRKPATS